MLALAAARLCILGQIEKSLDCFVAFNNNIVAVSGFQIRTNPSSFFTSFTEHNIRIHILVIHLCLHSWSIYQLLQHFKILFESKNTS